MQLESHLKVALYDKDVFRDDYIGVAKIPLSDLLQNQERKVYYDLVERSALKQASPKPVGRVGVMVRFNCTEIPQMKGDFKSKVKDIRRHKKERKRGLGPILGRDQLLHGTHGLGVQDQGQGVQGIQGIPVSGQQTGFGQGEFKDQGMIGNQTQPGLIQDQGHYQSRYPDITPQAQSISSPLLSSQPKPVIQGTSIPHGVTDYPGNQGPTGARPEERLLLDQQKQQLLQQQSLQQGGQMGMGQGQMQGEQGMRGGITEGQASLGLPIYPTDNSGYNQQPINRAY
jgi:hypothetical protein